MFFKDSRSHSVKQHDHNVFIAFCEQFVHIFERRMSVFGAETFQDGASKRHERIVVIDFNSFVHFALFSFLSFDILNAQYTRLDAVYRAFVHGLRFI